jgi:hypothetical protein
MTHRTDRHAIRTRLRMVVKFANGHGWPVVYAVIEVE